MGEQKLIAHRDKLITINTFVGFRNNYIFGRLTKSTFNFLVT
jgi:hypothetical protein